MSVCSAIVSSGHLNYSTSLVCFGCTRMISLALADLAVLVLGVVFGDALNPLDEKLTREVIFEQNTWSCLFYVLNSKHVACSPNDKSDSFILGYIMVCDT